MSRGQWREPRRSRACTINELYIKKAPEMDALWLEMRMVLSYYLSELNLPRLVCVRSPSRCVVSTTLPFRSHLDQIITEPLYGVVSLSFFLFF